MFYYYFTLKILALLKKKNIKNQMAFTNIRTELNRIKKITNVGKYDNVNQKFRKNYCSNKIKLLKMMSVVCIKICYSSIDLDFWEVILLMFEGIDRLIFFKSLLCEKSRKSHNYLFTDLTAKEAEFHEDVLKKLLQLFWQ